MSDGADSGGWHRRACGCGTPWASSNGRCWPASPSRCSSSPPPTLPCRSPRGPPAALRLARPTSTGWSRTCLAARSAASTGRRWPAAPVCSWWWSTPPGPATLAQWTGPPGWPPAPSCGWPAPAAAGSCCPATAARRPSPGRPRPGEPCTAAWPCWSRWTGPPGNHRRRPGRRPWCTSTPPARPPRRWWRSHGHCHLAWSPSRLGGAVISPARATRMAPRPSDAGASAMAAALLVTAGAGAWYSLLGGTVLRVAPLGAVVVLVAARRLSPRQGGALLALWFPAAVLAAGVPADRLLPHAWPSVLARLSTGAQRLTASQGALITNQPWPLAAWLLLIGVVWVAGTALAASNPRSARRRILGFGILTAPWIAAVLLSTVGASLTHPSGGWHGATILLAGLLWATAGRVAIRPALALGMAAALISVGVAQAAGPRGRWFSPGPQTGSALQFRTLQTEPTYGPLQGRRSGSAMLEITASQPALWRMRVLILFAGPGWRIGYPPGELPEPAGRNVETTVRVRGLRDDLLVAPGRIVAIHARATPHPAPGEAWQLTPAPDRGDAYQTQASVVHATAKQLGGAPAPTDQRLQVYTRLTPGYAWPSVGVPLFGQAPDPKVTAILDRTPYGPVAALARQLAAGASTQLDVVAR